MATSQGTSRTQRHALNGFVASPLQWKHETTSIELSKNAPGMSHNRFDQWEENPTSTRVLDRSDDLLPRKKVKTEHALYHTTSGGPYYQRGDRNDTHSNHGHNSLIAPEHLSQENSPRSPADKKVLPLKEFFLDDTHYNSGNLMIYWLPCDSILIESDGRPIFGPFAIRTYAHTLIYHGPSSLDFPIDHDPVFQLKIRSSGSMFGSKAKCLTAKLDCSSLGAGESYYADLLVWLKDRVNTTRASHRITWTKTMRSDFSTRQEDSENIRRVEELPQAEQRQALRQIDERSEPVPPKKCSAFQSTLSLTPRRSTRNMSAPPRSPTLDSDKVILVYPSGVPGAVNITNRDYLRLRPGEFLNDTLIEFGLKLWIKKLEQSDAILASQIHVFSSFFFTKFSYLQKGNPNLNYETVRKWTSKLDIFQKKYIIVPVNENHHWYFAIICDPKYVLVPRASSNVSPPSTRQKTRQPESISETMVMYDPDETLTASRPVSASVSENARDEDKFPGDAEAEDTIHDFKSSRTISNFEPDRDVNGADGGESPSASDPFFIKIEDDGDNDRGSALSDTSKTYIFTFDSLGGQHPKVIRELSEYLKMEALDKKKIVITGKVGSKSVPVPAQPNFCDCGIYLLHLAQTFMSNPVHYRSMILANKEVVSHADRKAAWNDDQVSLKREDLRACIVTLSRKWMKEQAAKDDANHQETSSSHTVEILDSNCEIGMPSSSTSSVKSGRT